MKVTIDSDVLVYAFIEPTKKIYKQAVPNPTSMKK